MRKASTLVGLTLVALAATARAQNPAPPAAQRRIEVGLSVLPMGLGKFTASPGGMTFTADAAFSYGFALQAGYVLLPGLTLGLAPQAFFNVKPKEQGSAGAQEYDLMARVAYALRVVDTIALFAEALPGYSIILPPDGDASKGFVLGFGVGAAMDLSDRVFANLGVGYQVGFQKLPARDMSAEAKTRYLRLALGGGVRF
jgi:hypothetical protein